jgi:HK97 family phage major capsid protein
MGASWAGPWGEGPHGEAQPPEQPNGARTEPDTTRPYGMRPYGMRPYGMRPYGMRPYGMRPYGMRPYGMRPYGMRPYGMRGDDSAQAAADGYFDPKQWSQDIATLFCADSALIRLGARLVVGESELSVPTAPLLGVPQYLPAPERTDLSEEEPQKLTAAATKSRKELQTTADAARATLTRHHLRPRRYELAVKIFIRDHLLPSVTMDPEIAWALKQDIAHALAVRADEAFLQGDPAEHGPSGITADIEPFEPTRGGLLGTVRGMVSALRCRGARFGNAGWVLHPSTLDELTTLVTPDFQEADDRGKSLDSTPLLVLDGEDGGALLGYPFVVSTAATDRKAAPTAYFSSDWSEAWIGADPGVVAVDVSAGARFQTDETVVRAVMYHDFFVRRPTFFLYFGEMDEETPAAEGSEEDDARRHLDERPTKAAPNH